MIVVNSHFVAGYEVIETLGLVLGNTIQAKHLGKDIVALLRTIVGGEISEYTELITEARKIAFKRMIKQAESKGADAIINVHFSTAQVMQGAAEILAYGTAVRLREIVKN